MICAVFKTALRACRREWTAWTRSERSEEVMDSIRPKVRWIKCQEQKPAAVYIQEKVLHVCGSIR